LYRAEFPGGRRQFYEGEKGAERIVLMVTSSADEAWCSFFNGDAKFEKIAIIVRDDGAVCYPAGGKAILPNLNNLKYVNERERLAVQIAAKQAQREIDRRERLALNEAKAAKKKAKRERQKAARLLKAAAETEAEESAVAERLERLERLERHHAEETAKNEREAEERRAVRAAAEAAKAAKAPKPFTPAGLSHQKHKPGAGAVDPLAPTGAAEHAKEETRQKASIEAAAAHAQALKAAEAERIAALEARAKMVSIGAAISTGSA